MLDLNTDFSEMARFTIVTRIITNVLFHNKMEKKDKFAMTGLIADEPLIRCKTCDK